MIIEPLLGWRALAIHSGQLYSLHRSKPWSGLTVESECRRCGSRPEAWCTCGLHACHSLWRIRTYLYTNLAPAILTSIIAVLALIVAVPHGLTVFNLPIIVLLAFDVLIFWLARRYFWGTSIALVAASGQIQNYRGGFRAESQRVICLVRPIWMNQIKARQLSQSLGVPIFNRSSAAFRYAQEQALPIKQWRAPKNSTSGPKL